MEQDRQDINKLKSQVEELTLRLEKLSELQDKFVNLYSIDLPPETILNLKRILNPKNATVFPVPSLDGTILTNVDGAVKWLYIYFSSAWHKVQLDLSSAVAPSTTASSAFTSVYGGTTPILGTPTAWTSLKVGSTIYKLPLY